MLFVFVWGIVFLVALFPGAFLGWLIGKLSVPTFACVALVTSLSIFVGLFVAEFIFGGGSTAHGAGAQLTFVLLVPPVLLPMLIGVWVSRAKARTNPQPQ